MRRKKTAVGVILAALFLACFLPYTAGADDFFSRFEITELSIKGHKLHIRGETDLPDGSFVHASVSLKDFEDKPGKDHTVKVHVNNHMFLIQVDLPKKAGKELNLINLKVAFRPKDQPNHIKAKVGLKGENLKGNNVKVQDGEKIFFVAKNIFW
jgi:hypothetical protein